MTDDDIERRLLDHGTAWREANRDRPGIDWDAVTLVRPHRSRFAVVGVSVAAAAIIVPLAITAGGHTSTSPPAPSPPASQAGARVGAPNHFVALEHGAVAYVKPNHNATIRPGHLNGVALGVNADGSKAYGAFPESGCRTYLERFWFDGQKARRGAPVDLDQTSHVATISGHADPVPMAVSPDGTNLAMVVTSNSAVEPDKAPPPCVGAAQLVIINLATHQIRRWNAPRGDSVTSLAWSPDDRHLAFLLAPACAFLSYSDSTCGKPSSGTRILDTNAAGANLASRPEVLPMLGRDQGETYGPVFWWHGQLVTVLGNTLYPLNGHGGIGKAAAGGFPTVGGIASISSDPSGNHLLLAMGGGVTWRWDKGVVTFVPGEWTQPGW